MGLGKGRRGREVLGLAENLIDLPGVEKLASGIEGSHGCLVDFDIEIKNRQSLIACFVAWRDPTHNLPGWRTRARARLIACATFGRQLK